MKEEQFRILKVMNEATNRMDINKFAEAVNLSPNQAIVKVQELANEGFLHKVGAGFGLTDKGKKSIKAFAVVSDELGFKFYVDVDKPLGFSANSLADFYRSVKKVASDSLEFHLYRGDFENWLREVLKNEDLAIAVGKLKADGLQDEDLRKGLLRAIETKYGVEELL